MTYRLLGIALCLHAASGCVPVKPGEDMPCPSVPQAPSAPRYVTSPLKSKTENGAKVYYCDLPENLLTVDGNGIGENPPTLTLVCKPNSGMFVLSDGKAVGSEKYICGIREVPCKPLTDYNGGPITGVEHSALPAPVMTGSTSTWKCAAPAKLYKITNQDPASAQPVPGDASIVCNRLTGMLTVQPANTDVDPAMEEYVCGIKGCNKCDMTKLLDKTNAACKTQPDYICTGTPTIGDNAGCPTLSCGMDTLTVFMTGTTATTVKTPTTVACDNGVWKYDAASLDPADIGFVCAKDANCVKCDTKVLDAYSKMEAMWADIMKPILPPIIKYSCEYSCPASYLLMANNMLYDKVVCQMDSEKVTVNTAGGLELTPAKQFSCNKCNCMQDGLKDGAANGLCPFGSICVKPIPVNMKENCEATCPMDSSPIYQTAAGMLMMSPKIMCSGADWIVAGKDDVAGVACQFAANKGYTTVPPVITTQCPKLDVEQCPATSICDASQLIYIDAGGAEARATCKMGSLVTDKTAVGDMGSIFCNQQGPWESQISKANCVTDASQVADCLAWLTDASVVNNVNHDCQYGTCRLSCKGANQQFKYEVQEVPVKMEMAKYINCLQGEPVPAKGGVFTPTPITCV